MAALLLSVETIQLFHSLLVLLKDVISGATAFSAHPNCIATRQEHAMLEHTLLRFMRGLTHQQTRNINESLYLYIFVCILSANEA